MLIDLTDEERLLITIILEQHAHEQADFATTTGVMGTAAGDHFKTRAAQVRTVLKKFDQVARDRSSLFVREGDLVNDPETGSARLCVNCKCQLVIREGSPTCPRARSAGSITCPVM
jgi:hypothetical protein